MSIIDFVESDALVDCLLWRDDSGALLGILYYYAYDIPPRERAGNVTVLVDPDRQREGIGIRLLAEADRRWRIDFDTQDYTSGGLALATAYEGRRSGPENSDHVTREQAEAVLAAVKKQFAGYVLAAEGNPDDLPRLVWDYVREDGVMGPAIVWESGSPDEWALLFPGGGVDEEIVTLASDVIDAERAVQLGTVEPADLPEGVEVQAELSFVLAIYPPYKYD